MTEKADKKDVILDAAEKLFSEVGFSGASTRAIAAAAGVNMAMLNYYFGSKTGLYQAVLERRIQPFRQQLIDLNEEKISSWEKLNRCIELIIDRVVSNNCFHRLVHYELSLEQRSEMKEFLTESLLKNANEVKKIIEEGIENGSFRQVDVEMTVSTIFGTKNYITHSPNISSRFLNKNVQEEQILVAEIKPRIKKHLKDLLKAYLNTNETSK
ncbi:TetR/AcrR family transcriptional regulator [Rubrolithibacter danxiaensis]|uniref:TetR/AcrR family transcriptional regulator n=1 Tax=Rubrolithibacter danxiaensis TaxID=3390805 RepID=UPI003BF923EA